MAKCAVLYKTDFHHSFNSRDLIGVYTNKIKFEKAVKKIITEDLKKNSGRKGEALQEDITWNLGFMLDKKQTQGLCTFELVFEELEINKIF